MYKRLKNTKDKDLKVTKDKAFLQISKENLNYK